MKREDMARAFADQTESAEQLSSVFKALAHPTRVEIVRQLAMRQHCCGGDLCDCLPLAQSTISQHLDLLKASGIVEWRQEGTRSIFTLNRQRLDEVKVLLDSIAEPAQCVRANNESKAE